MRKFLLAFALIVAVSGLRPSLAQNKPSLQEIIADLITEVCNTRLPSAARGDCLGDFIEFSLNGLLLALATAGVETAKIAGDAAAADRFSGQVKSALAVLNTVEARAKHYKALERR